MGKNTKIICTVIPNPYKENKTAGRYYFSVFLSPRLPESGRLMDYYEIHQWYEFWDFFRTSQFLKLAINSVSYEEGQKTNTYTIGKEIGNVKIKFDSTELDRIISKIDNKSQRDIGKGIYKKLFKNNTPVSGWILDEGGAPVKQVVTYGSLEKSFKNVPKALSKINEGKGKNKKASEVLEDIQILESKGEINSEAIVSDDHSIKFLKETQGSNQSIDEIKLRNKENQEFHKKLSILSHYPHLMRLTGWICDFYIEADSSADSFSNLLQKIGSDPNKKTKDRALMKLDLSEAQSFIKDHTQGSELIKWINFFNEVDFKTPWTYIEPSTFSVKYSEVFASKYFDIKGGFVNNSNKLLNASQFDMKDYVRRKLLTIQSQMSQKDKDKLSGNFVDPEYQSGKNSTGISVFVNAEVLKTAILNNPDSINLQYVYKEETIVTQLQEVNIENYILFGHNIDTGYRIDVARLDVETGNPEYRSLCKRVADYKVDLNAIDDSKGPEDSLITKFEDEPWISESAQAGTSGVLYVDEELFRWNNWSLTCPHLGKYPQDEIKSGTDETVNEFNDVELINIYPFFKQGTKIYGESMIPLRFDRQYAFRIRIVDLCGNGPQSVDRLPQIAGISEESFWIKAQEKYRRMEPVEPVEIFHSSEMYLGEDLRTMVIRSNVDDKGIVDNTKKEAVRSISPPRITPHLAELHGVFDKENDFRSIYSFLSKEDNEFRKAQEDGIHNEKNVNFTTDPLVYAVKLKSPEGNYFKELFSEREDESYLERKYVNIKLTNEATTSIEKDRQFNVSLEPGKMSFYDLIPEIKGVDNKDEQGKLAIKLIHAVQRPIFINSTDLNKNPPNALDLNPVDRTPQKAIDVKLACGTALGLLKVPMGTTGELKVIASCFELERSSGSENGYKESKTPTVFVTTFSNLSEELEIGTGKLKMPKLIVTDENADVLLANPNFKELSHSFGDTKYREVQYQLQFVSKFKEFISNDDQDEDYFIRKINFTESKRVLNSQKPKALQIEYVIPLFSWVTDIEKKSVTRTNNSFRVYFEDNEWFTTGKGEGIAVLQKKEATIENGIKYNVTSVEDGLLGFVSEFGKDPAVNNQKPNLDISRLFKGEDNDTKQTQVMSNLLAKEPSKFSTTPSDISKNSITVTPYKVKFDGKKFYCDIILDSEVTKDFYTPFLKLALARYQENSITKDKEYDLRFSNVVMAPQVQVLPKRQVALAQTKITLDTFNILKTDYNGHTNEFWLITEHIVSANKITSLISSDSLVTITAKTIPVKSSIIELIDKNELSKGGRVFIEEYEYYEVGNTFKQGETNGTLFKMDEKAAGYNPRNDARKRLIFTYDLNEFVKQF